MSTSSIFGTTGQAARRQRAAKKARPRERGMALPGDPVEPGLADATASLGAVDADSPARERRSWIGTDLAAWTDWAAAPSSRTWLPLVTLALILSLGISALRIDLIRTRYALADVAAREEALLAEQRELIAHKRSLRSPTILARLARERGFRPVAAARVLVDPMPWDPADTAVLPEAIATTDTTVLPEAIATTDTAVLPEAIATTDTTGPPAVAAAPPGFDASASNAEVRRR